MTINTANFETFLAISQWLTGFESIELQGTGMTQTYFSTMEKHSTPTNINGFMEESRHILDLAKVDTDKAKARTQSHLMQNSSFECLGKQIILMWYTGQWFASPAADPDNAEQIDAQSYIEALMWPASDTHPPGAKQPGYASWAQVPTSVTSYNLTME